MRNRAGLLVRCVARAVDFILVAAAMELLPISGWLGGVLYILISDGIMEGRSLGKRIVGLRVLTKDGMPCSIRSSMLRNSTLAAGLLLFRIPYLGWICMLVVLAVELMMMFGSEEHARTGDEIAGTYVIEEIKPAEPAAREGEKKEIA